MCANGEEIDQTPRSVASGLCLHCLPMSHEKSIGLYGLTLCYLVSLANEFCKHFRTRSCPTNSRASGSKLFDEPMVFLK